MNATMEKVLQKKVVQEVAVLANNLISRESKVYRVLTPQAVLDTARTLILAGGYTTTLGVKRALRRNGFWALQKDISMNMAYLAELDFLSKQLIPGNNFYVYLF